MKKLFCVFCVFISFLLIFPQAKKNLTSKKSQILKASKNEEKVQTPVVYNEDFEKGEELFTLNKPEEAIVYFEKCIDVKDVNPLVWVHLGVAYYQIGDFTRSLACCTKGLTKQNTDHKILAYNAGNSAYALTNYARAEACYAISIKEDESFAPAYLNRANSQLKQDRLQDAKMNYIKYLELEPESLQKQDIEKLLILLDEEILRRSKEKPEKIDLDFANVKNDEMIFEIPVEKVALENENIEEKNDEDVKEELVNLEIAKAPEISEDEKNLKESTEVVTQEKVEPNVEDSQFAKDEDSAQGNELQNIYADNEEIFDDEELADALYKLPAGKVSIKALAYGFSPYSTDSKKQKQYFNIAVSDKKNVESYVFEILDEKGRVVRTTRENHFEAQLEWDGKTDSGLVASGRFTARLTVSYAQGGLVTAQSSAFTCFSDFPQVSIEIIEKTENLTENSSISDELLSGGKLPIDDKSTAGDKLTVDSELPVDDRLNIDDKLKFAVKVESESLIESWKFEIKDEDKTIYQEEGKTLPSQIEVNKKDLLQDFTQEKTFDCKITVRNAFGLEAQDSCSIKL